MICVQQDCQRDARHQRAQQDSQSDSKGVLYGKFKSRREATGTGAEIIRQRQKVSNQRDTLQYIV
jgi:hypothetical protein